MLQFETVELSFSKSSNQIHNILCEGFLTYASPNRKYTRVEYFAGYPEGLAVVPIKALQELPSARRAALAFLDPSVQVIRVCPTQHFEDYEYEGFKREHSAFLRGKGYRP